MIITNEKKYIFWILAANFFVGVALFGLVSTLMLYLVNIGVGDNEAYVLWKNYDVLIFIVALLGGAVTSRYLSLYRACEIGMVLCVLGFSVLAFKQNPSVDYINFGLSFLSCGAGLLVNNLKGLMASILTEHLQRYNGFTWLHTSDVLAQISGPILLTLTAQYSHRVMFLAAGITVFISILILTKYLKSLEIKKANSRKEMCLVILILLLVMSVLHYGKAGFFLAIVTIALVFFLNWLHYTSGSEIRYKLVGFALVMFGMLVSSICFRQIISIFNLFTERYVDRALFHSVIPTGYFQAIEPTFVLILAPVFVMFWTKLTKKNKVPSIGVLFSCGLLLLNLAFLLLYIGILDINTLHQVNMIWLIFSYLAMAAAELLILPTGLAAVTELAPRQWRGVFIGSWLLLIAQATYINAFLGQIITPPTGHTPLVDYQLLFQHMAIFVIVSASILLIGWLVWKRAYMLSINKSIER